MYCKKCGTQNDDNAWKCTNCGTVLQQATPSSQQPAVKVSPSPQQPAVSNYLVQAILCTLFCCLPFGIPAIVFAAQVNGKLAAGDVAGAMESSRKAKIWCWVAFGAGLGWILIYGVIVAIGVISQGDFPWQ